MKIIELTIDDNAIDNGLSLEAISLVNKPAIEINFLALSKDKTSKSFKFEEVKTADKQMIYGPALIPNKLILRKTEANEYYSVYFSEATVEKCAKAYMSKSFNSFSVDHENDIKNVNIIENWLVTDPDNDKANAIGFKVPKGTWMVGAKIENEGIWERIKAGELKGFSIEGFFTEAFSKLSLKKELNEEEWLEERLNEIEKIDNKDEIGNKILELYNMLKTN
jgi:hypothetical protein